MIEERTEDRTENRTDACRRCGTCCRKGGPALHHRDIPAVRRGAIPLKHLYTLRRGEPVWDNVRGGVAPLTEELIKIKEGPDGRACTFFGGVERGCTIYDHRPLECRVLKCWDTREIEAVYTRDRLRRKDLLESVPQWWDLVVSHQRECDIDGIRISFGGAGTDGTGPGRIIAYDRELRRLITEKAGIDPEILDFLLGRPLSRMMPGGRFTGRPHRLRSSLKSGRSTD